MPVRDVLVCAPVAVLHAASGGPDID